MWKVPCDLNDDQGLLDCTSEIEASPECVYDRFHMILAVTTNECTWKFASKMYFL